MIYTNQSNQSIRYRRSQGGHGVPKHCTAHGNRPLKLTKKVKKPGKRFPLPKTAGIVFILTLFFSAIKPFSSAPYTPPPRPDSGPALPSVSREELPEEMKRLLELNEEAADYVREYPRRETYRSSPVDLSEDFVKGQVPLLMQWDRRWGYNDYGDSNIGLAGCGPVCLNMAYLYFTEDTSMTPREMAEFASDNGYCTSAGTSWSLWTEGIQKLGLSGSELPLDEGSMHRALDEGGLIVCSMGPGDFTTEGHFILIRGYDENGFYVNDPNRRSNSEKQWDYTVLHPQIRNLWELRPL